MYSRFSCRSVSFLITWSNSRGCHKRFLRNCPGFSLGQFFRSTTSGRMVARHSIRTVKSSRAPLESILLTEPDGGQTFPESTISRLRFQYCCVV